MQIIDVIYIEDDDQEALLMQLGMLPAPQAG